MSVLGYTRFATAAVLAFTCGLATPAFRENALAAEYDGLSQRPDSFDILSNIVLEEPVNLSPLAPSLQSGEPFGSVASAPLKDGIAIKWRGVKQRLAAERAVLARCRARTGACPPAAERFLAVLDRAQIHQGWARIAEINRTINLDIEPVDDMTQYGVVDLWATPLMAFKSNAGDCEDYAIAKYVALHELGMPLDDLRIVIVHIDNSNEDHAVAAVRYDGNWLILDNRTLKLRHDAEISDYNPLFIIDSGGARRVTARISQPRGENIAANRAAHGRYASSDWSNTLLLRWGLNDWPTGDGPIVGLPNRKI